MILNTKSLLTNPSNLKIFFGEYSGFQRYDFYKYSFAKRIEEQMRNAFWNPNEISLVSDRIKFTELPKHIQQIITLNLLFQTLMDSGQGRGIESSLLEIVTSPEFEGVFKTLGYFEYIHSLSYSHILREVFPDATEVFDSIDQNDYIKHRIDKEVAAYQKLKNINDIENEEEKKKLVLELLIRIFFLEGIKFYVSFLVTYTINNSYNNKIQGITRIIKLINFDEDKHVAVGSGTLNILKKNPEEGFSELIKSSWYETKVQEICDEVVSSEIGWGKYLLSHGPIPSLTIGIIENFVKFYANLRLQALGFDPTYQAEKSDIVSWFETYKNIDLDNVAQQEGEGLAYQIGILQNDIPEGKINFTEGLL